MYRFAISIATGYLGLWVDTFVGTSGAFMVIGFSIPLFVTVIRNYEEQKNIRKENAEIKLKLMQCSSKLDLLIKQDHLNR